MTPSASKSCKRIGMRRSNVLLDMLELTLVSANSEDNQSSPLRSRNQDFRQYEGPL